MVEDRAHAGPWRFAVPVAAAVVLVGVVAALASSGGGDDGSLRSTQAEPAANDIGTADATTTVAPATAVATTTVAPATTLSPAGGTAVTTTPAGAGARIQVKFVDGSGVRLRDGRLVSQTGADLTALQTVLARSPGSTISRLFSRPEEDLAADKAAAEVATDRPQPDLNLHYRLTLAPGADPAAVIADLGRLPIVQTAAPEPVAAPPPAP